MAQDDLIDFELFRYTPSQAAAGLFAGLFFLTTIFHLYQVHKSRAWYFIPFVAGGIFQVVGYLVRIPAHNNPESVPIFALQALLILLAPPLYAAAIYMVLGRLIRFLGAEGLSLIRVSWMTKIFVTGDVIAFLAQAAGGGLMASDNGNSFETGENITIGGLAVQLVFFTIFMVSCGVFHYRIRKTPTPEAESLPGGVIPREKQGKARRLSLFGVSWETIIVGLYVASLLILIRSIFRLVEYVQGNDGYLISHEVFPYVFDGALMFFAMLVMNFYHPSRHAALACRSNDM
ncbi:RTA1 like protein [Aspergillus heterothallicus]